MKRVVTFNPHYQRQMLGCMLQNEAASFCTLKKHRFIDRQMKRYKHVYNQGQAMHRIRTRQERNLGVETSSQPALEPRLANCQIRNILEACHQKTSWVPAPSLLGTSDRVPLILCHFHIQWLGMGYQGALCIQLSMSFCWTTPARFPSQWVNQYNWLREVETTCSTAHSLGPLTRGLTFRLNRI